MPGSSSFTVDPTTLQTAGASHRFAVRASIRCQATFLAGLLASSASVLSASEATVTNLSLPAAITFALHDNPELASLRAKREAMLERPAQAEALPNPMLKYSGMDDANGGRWPNTTEKRLMVEQEFPWFGKRDLRAGIARTDATLMQHDLESMTRDVVMMVKEAFFDLSAVQKAADITRHDAEVLRRIAKLAEALYTTGQRTEQDLLKAQSEVTMLQQRLLELATQENALQAKLNTLLNRRPDAPLGQLTLPPPIPDAGRLERLFDVAVANSPEVHAEETRIGRYELERQLMQKESLPDYRLGLEYRHLGRSDDMMMFTISVDLPLWEDKYEASVREAEKMKAASAASKTAAEHRSAFEVQDAGFKLQTARHTLDLYRKELIPQAEARFHASEAGYQTGKVDFMDLLESQRFLLNARVMAAMAEGNLGMQAARLERATGMDLTN